MKSTSKRVTAALVVAAYALMVLWGLLSFLFPIRVNALVNDRNVGLTYFYDELGRNPMAERFYKAFEKLEENGSFKRGQVDLDLVAEGVVTGAEVTEYVDNGNPKIPVAFGSGRDAFLMDNPDLFYIDIFGVSISAGSSGGQNVAYMDTSRVSSLYRGGGINGESAVESAINAYEAKIAEIVSVASTKSTDKEKVEYVNKYIIDHTEYSYGTQITDGVNVSIPGVAEFVDTSYGALVNGKALCGGYAKAFKAVMDRLNVPCVLVQGSSRSTGSEAYVAHMWNYVRVEGMWYAVDVTWNDTSEKHEEWLLVGEQTMSIDHITDGVISSSNFELKYPALKPFNYGVDEDASGMNLKGEYQKTDDNHGTNLTLDVVYDGKGAKKLIEDGKYLVYRLGDYKNGAIVWENWYETVAFTEYGVGFAEVDHEDKTVFHITPNMQYIQFGLMDYAPDETLYVFGDPITRPDGSIIYLTYVQEEMTDEHLTNVSAPYCNDAFGTYVAPPWPIKVTPGNTGDLKVEGTYDVTIKYSEKLVLADGVTDPNSVGLDITTARGNNTIAENVKIENFKWDGNDTITFTLTPSQMFIHNQTDYFIIPTNVVGAESGKVPHYTTYSFKRKSVVCSKIFNDGRLYMNVMGDPKMLDTSDVSMNGFKDENGNWCAENQRSQLLLVASRPSDKKSEQLENMLEGSETGLEQGDVIETATYEINLQICGVVRNVPNGSYMRVAFGFPEEFGSDTEEVTYKIYHYDHDEHGNIIGVREIPVIITQYGIIAEVDSFSPFALVKVKADSAAAQKSDKSIYASSGNGGTISNSGISSVAEGESKEYVFTPEDGFEVGTVTLNGTVLDSSRYEGNKLTLTADELNSDNTLDVAYVTASSKAVYEEKNVTLKTPNTIVVKTSDIPEAIFNKTSFDNSTTGNGNGGEPMNDTLAAGIAISCVLVAAAVAAGVGIVIYVKKHKSKI